MSNNQGAIQLAKKLHITYLANHLGVTYNTGKKYFDEDVTYMPNQFMIETAQNMIDYFTATMDERVDFLLNKDNE